jgi:hypothetical protein
MTLLCTERGFRRCHGDSTLDQVLVNTQKAKAYTKDTLRRLQVRVGGWLAVHVCMCTWPAAAVPAAAKTGRPWGEPAAWLG